MKVLGLTAEHLRAVVDYDPETGVFRWKRRPDYPLNWNRRFVGAIAGSKMTINGKTYWAIRIDDCLHRAHRLAWLYVHGEWPKRTIDHEDGDGLHNWIDNLREATQRQQTFNRPVQSNSVSGIKGIQKRGNSYRVRVTANGKTMTRSFVDLDRAKEWHTRMSRFAHGPFAHQPKETPNGG